MTASTKPGDHVARQRAYSIRRIRKELHLYTEARRYKGARAQDLLAGMEFLGGDSHEDVRLVIGDWLDEGSEHKLPGSLVGPMQRLRDKPTVRTARSLRKALLRVDAAVRANALKMIALTHVELNDLADRCDVWAAEWGDTEASLRCAKRAYAGYRYTASPGITISPDGWGMLRCVFQYLDRALQDDVGLIRPLADRATELRHLSSILRGVQDSIGVVFDAVDAGPWDDEEDEPASAARPEDRPKDAFDGFDPLDGLDDDRAGIVRTGSQSEPFPLIPQPLPDWFANGPRPKKPTMLVLRSIDHLPKGGSGGRGDAYKDGEKIAGKQIPLARVEDLAEARLLLDDEFPHLAAITNRILTTQVGRDFVKLPNILLLGQPGVAKTRYGRRLAEDLGLKPVVYPCTGQADAMFGGTNRGWSSGRPCNPAQAIISSGIANPAFVLDEVEKAGQSRHNGSLHDVLINMMEGESSARYVDPYFEAPLNLSAVNWILTANSLAGIPQPFLDRCLVISVPAPGPEHLEALAAIILDDLRGERGLDESWCPGFDGMELEALRAHWPGGSLRALRQLVAAVLDARDATAPRQ